MKLVTNLLLGHRHRSRRGSSRGITVDFVQLVFAFPLSFYNMDKAAEGVGILLAVATVLGLVGHPLPIDFYGYIFDAWIVWRTSDL